MAAAATPDHHTCAVAVVGLGMIGSAACRYLASLPDPSSPSPPSPPAPAPAPDSSSSSSAGTAPAPPPADEQHHHDPYTGGVVGIGPSEPADWSTHTGAFASHYDAARVTRALDADPVWAALAARSMARYADLEAATGVRFHSPSGFLRVTPCPPGHPGCTLRRAHAVGSVAAGAPELVELVDGPGAAAQLRGRFPWFRFQDGDAAVVERGAAGHVDPRRMVAAQVKAAEAAGARIVREAAAEILLVRGDEGDEVEVRTEGGTVVRARKVLVCADAYTPALVAGAAGGAGGRTLALTTHKVSVLLTETGPAELARLRGMPSFIWRVEGNPFLRSVYGCPPVAYPDGKEYLKVGGTAWEPQVVTGGRAEIADWFHSCDQWDAETDALREVVRELVPGLAADSSVVRKPCIVTYTAHGYPYVDAVDGGENVGGSRVFVAAGGCGAAAKSSDEIGRMAALLVRSGRWAHDMDRTLFAAVWIEDGGGQGS